MKPYKLNLVVTAPMLRAAADALGKSGVVIGDGVILAMLESALADLRYPTVDLDDPEWVHRREAGK